MLLQHQRWKIILQRRFSYWTSSKNYAKRRGYFSPGGGPGMKTEAEYQAEIDRTIAVLRESGMPDFLNRWLEMTPAKLAEQERTMARARRRLAVSQEPKLILNSRKGNSGLSLPRSIEPAGLAILREAKKEKERTAKAKAKTRKESLMAKRKTTAAMPPAPPEGSEPAAPVDAASTKIAAPPAPPGEAAASEESEMTTRTRRGKSAGSKKSAAASSSARKPKSAPAVDGKSKVEVIGGLLRRDGGCTAKDVMEATGWPSVSMPAQAKALGVKMKQKKEGRVTRYWTTAA
jgi:hypothetical protein